MPDHEHPPAASPDSPPWSSRVKIVVGVMTLVGVALAAPTIASLRILGRHIYAKLFELDPFPPPEPVPAILPRTRFWI